MTTWYLPFDSPLADRGTGLAKFVAISYYGPIQEGPLGFVILYLFPLLIQLSLVIRHGTQRQ